MTRRGEEAGRRVLALLSDAHGGHGGIAAYNRDFLEVVCGMPQVGQVIALPRIAKGDLGELPAKLCYDLSGLAGARAYVTRALRIALDGCDFVVCGHINLAPLAWLAARLARARWTLQIHGMEAWQPHPRRLVRASAGRADAVLAVSQFSLDRFREWRPYPDRAAHALPNAVRLENFAPGPADPALASRYGLQGKRVIMTLGRLDPTEKAKGFDRIIALLPRLAVEQPDIAYLIVGSGDDRSRLATLASSLGVADRVVFAGFVPEAEKAAHYRLADVYAMPGKLEGFGFAYVEAMACGIPVIGSSVDGSREPLMNGKLGALVDPDDPEEIATAIRLAFALPKRVPPELNHFKFERFAERLRGALAPVLTD